MEATASSHEASESISLSGNAAGSSSRRATQTYADKALAWLLRMTQKFQSRFSTAMQGKESGYITLRIEFDRGIVNAIRIMHEEVDRPKKD
jgi:hypothetical protein